MHISQREARRLRKRVEELEYRESSRTRRWGSDYPGGTHFQTLFPDAEAVARINTVQLLEHAIVGRISGKELYLYAVKVKP